MRQPLEDRIVSIARSKMAVEYPASFMFVAAMNPCQCGYYNHPEIDCSCPPGSIQRYLNKISGPLLDRIDIHIEVTPVPFKELSNKQTSEKSIEIRKRVIAAREIQKLRFEKAKGVHANAQMSSKMIRTYCNIDETGNTLLKTAMERLKLSARAYDRILKVARTIADLDNSPEINTEHLSEAIHYRSLDRENWGK
jgi:magnesium chelatase family protein